MKRKRQWKRVQRAKYNNIKILLSKQKTQTNLHDEKLELQSIYDLFREPKKIDFNFINIWKI